VKSMVYNLSDLSSHLDVAYEVVAVHSSAKVIQVKTSTTYIYYTYMEVTGEIFYCCFSKNIVR